MEKSKIPKLPKLEKEQLYEYDLEYVIERFRGAENRFTFCESAKGEIDFYFDKLDAPLYASLVVCLSQRKYQKVYEFLKLVLEAVYQVKKCNKKGNEVAGRIENYFQI